MNIVKKLHNNFKMELIQWQAHRIRSSWFDFERKFFYLPVTRFYCSFTAYMKVFCQFEPSGSKKTKM